MQVFSVLVQEVAEVKVRIGMETCPTCLEKLDGTHCGLYCKAPEDDLLQLAKDISAQRDRALAMVLAAQEQTRIAQNTAAQAIKALRDHLDECHK